MEETSAFKGSGNIYMMKEFRGKPIKPLGLGNSHPRQPKKNKLIL